MEEISAIFSKADQDNAGTLTIKEFQEVINDICERYPQVDLYLKMKQMKNIADLLKQSNAKESLELNIEEFKSALSEVDSQMKNLPVTAQHSKASILLIVLTVWKSVKRISRVLSGLEEQIAIVFAPSAQVKIRLWLGGEQTAAQLPGDWVSIGQSSQWTLSMQANKSAGATGLWRYRTG